MFIQNYCVIRNHELWVGGSLSYKEADKDVLPQVFFKNLYKFLEVDYPKFFKMDNLCKLGFLSADALIKNVLGFKSYDADNMGIILSNNSSSLNTDLKYFETIKNSDNYFPSPALFVYTLPNIIIGEIAIKHQIYGENNFLISEKFEPTFFYEHIKMLFEQNIIDSVLTGWIELNEDNYEAVFFFVSNNKPSNIPNENCIFEPENILKIFNN